MPFVKLLTYNYLLNKDSNFVLDHLKNLAIIII